MSTVCQSSLTILFEAPFWIGLYERADSGKYEVCKITFGSEPKDYEVYAVEQVLRHYRGYINKLCTGILYDKHGQPHVCIDEYMKRHLEIKLISSIVTKAETV